jgi:Xaa-Pro dipeptidase
MLTPSLLSSRHTKLAQALQESSLDAVAVNPGSTLTYLTGLHFHTSERPVVLLFAPGKTPALVLPELETRKVDSPMFPLQAFPYGENPHEWVKAFAAAAHAVGLPGSRVGVEARAMRVLELHYLEEAASGARFLPAEETFAALRMYKDAAEAEAMRRAADVAQKALISTLPLVQLGLTEKELAGELVIQLLRQGSSPAMPFSPIVSFGPNSANPHASPSARTLAAGDLLLFDWGAAVDDYYSDITRTFAVGEVEPEYAKIAALVQAANEAGRAAAKPGIPCSAVDKATRDVIEKAGYGKYFTHRTGHGLGMEGHEAPYIRSDNDQLLEPGMVFTVEPGIYLPDRAGVRIEDDVMITEDGAESFTDLPRELIRVL